MNDDLQTLVANYQLSPDVARLVGDTPIVLLVGISGAGKDTIKHHLINRGGYHHLISHTTRTPRENGGVLEQNGVEYHFIDKSTAIEMLQKSAFIEAKEYSGNLYGTSAAELEKAHAEQAIALTDLEVQGVAEYKAIADDVVAIFVLPPSFEEWQRRLLTRYGSKGVDPADMMKRMRTAIAELDEALSKPYYHFIINENLEDAVKSADKIAHDGNTFNTIDKSFRQWATQLRDELADHVAALAGNSSTLDS